jgi:15-cis-phytoene synthase
MQADVDHCAALVREGDRDRYLATLFAPAKHRGALFALYAFNLEIVRVRELAREPMPGEIRLNWWREAVAGEREGEATAHPVAAALRAVLARYNIATDRLIALIDAHSFDLYDEPMATMDDLDNYASMTQGALFRTAADILGGAGAVGEALSRHAGIANSVAGVLRGLPVHAMRRQLYIPLDLLARHAVDREAIFARQSGAPLSAALGELRRHARHHLAVAQEELAAARPEILPALLPLALVGPALRRMEQRAYEPFEIDLIPAWRRQWWLWRAARDPARIFAA